ncbi:MAG: SurA N-terminal domain-containing protein [Pseudomonadota bacterium]
MLSAFRNFFQSKFGLAIFGGIVALIAVSMTAGDLVGNTFGGISGGDQVALVGDDRIDAQEFSDSAESALRQVQGENPTLTMAAFVDQGLLDEVLNQMIDRYAIGAYAEKYGLRAGDNLVNSEILKFGAFKGVDGNFDQEAYQRALSQQGITDEILRRDLADGLLAQQLLGPAFASPQMPAKMARQYAALVTERRKGQIALIPSTAFTPSGDPKADVLAKFYEDNKARFTQPERRTMRYAVFGADQLKNNFTASQADIKARYESEPERFAASETRSVTSFLVPTEDAANSIAAQVRGGLSLEAAAQQAGFAVSTVENQTKEQMASSYSAAVADAVFKAQRGQIADPAASALGFYIARVDNITKTPARSLAQASDDIKKLIETEKTAAALASMAEEIEDDVDGGTSITDVAEKFDLEIVTTAPTLADGRIFNNPGTTLPQVLLPTLSTAFQMDESEPQLTELVPGEQFLVFDVLEVEEAAAPPLAQVREEVIAAWKLSEGSKKAKAAADRILKKVRGKSTLKAALDAEDGDFPPTDQIDLARQELMASRERGVPPALVLLFSMAEGSTKVLEAPNDAGWYVVDLDDISAETLASDSPILAQTRLQLAPALSNEYADQATAAIRAEIGVERNEAAIEAVRDLLLGNN